MIISDQIKKLELQGIGLNVVKQGYQCQEAVPAALCYIICACWFSLVCDYLIHLVVQVISLILKLLAFLLCDTPVSSTLAWWQ